VSVHQIGRNHGTKQLITFDKQSFTFLQLLGSISEDDKHEETKIIPSLELLVSACHQQNKKRTTPMDSPVCVRMGNFHNP
jgi:hypothetical protein